MCGRTDGRKIGLFGWMEWLSRRWDGRMERWDVIEWKFGWMD